MTKKVRLFGIDTPEIRGEEKVQGKISRDWLIDLVMGKEIKLVTERDRNGKYGRLLGTIYQGEMEKSINDLAIELGYAKKYGK